MRVNGAGCVLDHFLRMRIQPPAGNAAGGDAELEITVGSHDEGLFETAVNFLRVNGSVRFPTALEGNAHACGDFYEVPVVHDVTLGEIVALLGKFHSQPSTLILPEIPADSFAKKLYSTYQSYLPKEKIPIPLKMIVDARGSFTELMKTRNSGQFSINISKPGITKGQHWHHSKWEMFIVVSGHALIQERKIGSDEVIEYEVSGEKMEAYQMLPGYTHNLINLSDTEDLVTIVWANESFDPEHPDTFYEQV